VSTLYTSSKIFHFHEKLDAMQSGRITPPIHVRLKPTNRCQHRCGYCCYRNPDLYLSERMNESDEIPPGKMREIVEDLGRMGVRAVTFSGGGEPLCYPPIGEAIQALAGAGVKVAMLTNGGRLRGETAGLLARAATWVRVSMDAADRETYAHIRNVAPEEFDRVCANIRAFAGITDRRCVIGINLIVARENSSDVLRFLRMARELGADHVKVSNAIVSTLPAENAEYMSAFYQDVKRQVAEGIAELSVQSSAPAAQGRGGRTSPGHPPQGRGRHRRAFAVIDKVHLPLADAESLERRYTWCPMSQCLTVIAADQNVYTCQDKAYTRGGLLGSIRDTRFAELWASEDLQGRLRTLDPSSECRHHCVAHAKNLSLLDYFEADEEHLDFV